MRTLGAPLLGVLLAQGCIGECKSLAPAFQLDIRTGGSPVSLELIVEIGDEIRGRTFNLGSALDDGETSLVVELDPAITGPFDVDLRVTAYSDLDARGGVIGAAEQRFTGTPDGCNRFSIELDDVNVDHDGGVPDTSTVDAGPEGPCDSTCASAECNATCGPGCATCALSCAGATTICTTTCQESSTCTIDCAGVGECQSNCSGTSSCEVDCEGTLECKARCVGQATCRLDCLNAGECSFTTCEGVETLCADGSIVCDRACP